MSKYDKLTRYLEGEQGNNLFLNLGAIESILGFELPPSARQYPAWWANQGRGQSLAWQSAGWKTVDVSLSLGSISFVRVDSPEAEIWDQMHKMMTIQQAKAALAATFGVSPENVEITIRA